MCHCGLQRFALRLVVVCIMGGAVLRAQPPVMVKSSQTLSIGVVLDALPRPPDVIAFERQVVDSLGTALAGVADEGFAVSYSDHVQLVGDWSPVISGLKDAADRFAVDAGADRGAVLNDALMAGLTRLGSPNHGGRKALIVISEGNDSGSAAKFSQVLRTATAGHIQCFVLLVANHWSQVGRVRQFGSDLYRLASGTHGKAYDVRTNPKALDAALRDVLKRLASPPSR